MARLLGMARGVRCTFQMPTVSKNAVFRAFPVRGMANFPRPENYSSDLSEYDKGSEYWNRISECSLVSEIFEKDGETPPLVCQHPNAVEPVLPAEGAPDKFAVVLIHKRQFKVVANDLVMVDRIPDVDVGTIITLDKLLMVAGLNQTVVGRPLVPNATVTAEVQEHSMTKDVIVFKFKRRKGYKKTKIHNARVTILRIIGIHYTEQEV